MTTPTPHDPVSDDTTADHPHPGITGSWLDWMEYWHAPGRAQRLQTSLQHTAPHWARPYHVGTQDAFTLATATIHQALQGLGAGPESAEEIQDILITAAIRTGTKIRISVWAAGYAGLPLVAAHLAARATQAAIADDPTATDLIDKLITLLWPNPARASSPGNATIKAANLLNNHNARVGLGGVRGMTPLLRAARAAGDRYPVGVHKLLYDSVHGGITDQRRQHLARGLTAILKGLEPA